jgi:hypothetical protein
MSVGGTFETSRDVRSSVAIGKSDILRMTHFGSDWPISGSSTF